MTNASVQLLAAFAMVAAGAASASAAPVAGASNLRVPLSCHIANEKVIVVTNSTPGTIGAGTQMGYDAVRSGDGKHYGKMFGGSAACPRGASFQIGDKQSISCSAWYYRRLLMQAL